MGCMINEYMLRNRGGVRFKWQETPVNWFGKEYANIYAALYEERDKKGEKLTIPLCVLQGLLQFSNIQLLDYLNVTYSSSCHIITQLEPAFRKYEDTSECGDEPFFIPEDLFGSKYEHKDKQGILVKLRGYVSDYSVDILDFEQWANNNQDMLPENRYKPIASPGARDTELAERNKTIEEMKNATQEGAQGARVAKTDPREDKSMAKICAIALKIAGKDLHNQKTRAGIKRKLDENDLHMDDKTAKKYFDIIQGIMDKFPDET